MADAFHEVLILRLRGGRVEELVDAVAAERRIEFRLNGLAVLALFCTPRDLGALAVGFLLSEGLLSEGSRIDSIRVSEDRVDLEVRDPAPGWKDRLAGAALASGCGRGLTLADPARSGGLRPLRTRMLVPAERIAGLLKAFSRRSELFFRTGGVHSAALASPEGEILCFAEDIGRHNAVDKVIGMGFLKDLALPRSLLVSSGRVSTEIVAKAVRAGIPVLVSRAAPTCMSVTLAEEHGLTLVGFARGRRLNLYSRPDRIGLPAAESHGGTGP